MALLGPFAMTHLSAGRNQPGAAVPAAEQTKAPVMLTPPHQQQERTIDPAVTTPQQPSAFLPPPVFKLSEGVKDNPFARIKQKQGQQRQQEPADPLLAFLKKKQEREEQALTTARRPRMTAAALSADPAMTLPTRIPVAAELVSNVDGTADVELTLCEVDMAAYHREPARFPTLADVAARFCGAEKAAGSVVVLRASELIKDAEAGPRLMPAGLIFHQAAPSQPANRLSTLLASVPTNLVYSEPALLLDLLREMKKQSLPEADKLKLLRAAVLGMGRSRHHQDVFLELSPAFLPHMDLLLQAFPPTPWAFVYHRRVRI
jgi:hypothetical protein